ncbi:MAG: HepT-like ribonuclease domain-containing protein [Acidimicrobiales bacterium]
MEIARMRDHLAHRYFDTDHAIVQDVVDSDLGPLSDAVQSLIGQTRQDDEPS